MLKTPTITIEAPVDACGEGIPYSTRPRLEAAIVRFADPAAGSNTWLVHREPEQDHEQEHRRPGDADHAVEDQQVLARPHWSRDSIP